MWSNNGTGTVTITNHSNRDVTVTATCEDLDNNDKVAVEFTKTSDANDDNKIAAGEVGNFDGADTITYTVEVSGTLSKEGTATLATISVKIGE